MTDFIDRKMMTGKIQTQGENWKPRNTRNTRKVFRILSCSSCISWFFSSGVRAGIFRLMFDLRMLESSKGDVLKLIVGCGYLGLRVARRWMAAGHAVTGVVHSAVSAEWLNSEGVRPIVANVTQPSTLRDLPAAETVLYAAGYDPAGETSRSAVYVDGLRAVLDAVSPQVRRVILISSTGVYAELGGGWVDESSPCQPLSESGQALLAAERRWPAIAWAIVALFCVWPAFTVPAGCRAARSWSPASPCQSPRAST